MQHNDQSKELNNEQEIESITGLIVQASPKKITQIELALSLIEGVEVHLADPQGKLVVTVEEQAGEKTMIDRISQINQVEGVISTALVYSHHEAWS